MKKCLVGGKAIRFIGNKLVPPYCKKVEPIYNEAGDVIGQRDILDYECFRANSLRSYKEIIETACVDTTDGAVLLECLDPDGTAIYTRDGQNYLGYSENCLGVFTDPGVWTMSNLFYMNGQIQKHSYISTPQLGAKCQKSTPQKRVVSVEPVDSSFCGNFGPCVRYGYYVCN